jgi:hypothetical protein
LTQSNPANWQTERSARGLNTWYPAREVMHAAALSVQDLEIERLQKQETLESLNPLITKFVLNDMVGGHRADDYATLLAMVDTASSALAIAPDGTVEVDPRQWEMIKKHYGRGV